MSMIDELNKLPLVEASKRISDELIKEKSKLEDTRKKLLEEKQRYNEAYIAANDGDSSENAPLEDARLNLRLVTGKIANNEKLIQNMEGLEDAYYLRETYDFSAMLDVAEKLPENIKDKLLSLFGVNTVNNLPALLRKIKRSTYEGAVEEFEEFVEQMGAEDAYSLQMIVELGDLYESVKKPHYNSVGFVLPYSTVRLDMDGSIMTYKIYPEGISFIDIGVIAQNSRLAMALMNKHAGEVVQIQRGSKGSADIQYKILEVY